MLLLSVIWISDSVNFHMLGLKWGLVSWYGNFCDGWLNDFVMMMIKPYIWNRFFKALEFEKMGNTSSMLTQYDIEEVQSHCQDLCKIFFSSISLSLSLPICFWSKFVPSSVEQQEILLSLYQRFCQLDRNAKGIYIFWWVSLCPWVRHESTLSEAA